MNRPTTFLVLLALGAALLAAAARPADAAACAFESQGDGRFAEIVDGRSFRLDDGREIRLVGIEPVPAADARQALAAILAGRTVTLHSADDSPDRYGRQGAMVFLAGSDISVQEQLLSQGAAVVSGEIADRDCAAVLFGAETEARRARRGTWVSASAIKNAESPDDILTGIGRFAVVEGKVLSVRQAGATTYLNFGPRWTQDFAVTISRRMIPAFESAGLALKSLENKRIRVRGWVEGHSSPRIEVVRVGQIELLGATLPATHE